MRKSARCSQSSVFNLSWRKVCVFFQPWNMEKIFLVKGDLFKQMQARPGILLFVCLNFLNEKKKRREEERKRPFSCLLPLFGVV